MASNRQLKSKIRTVGNIKQITKAMQMVSATKMRKSQEVALQARPFAKKALDLLSRLSQNGQQEEQGIFWDVKEGKTCLIVITSDKGLCGSFNSQVLRQALSWTQDNEDVDVIAVGRKGKDFFVRRGITPVAEFSSFSDIVTLQDVTSLTEWVLQAFLKGEYAKVMIIYTEFVSALSQKPELHQVLPFDAEQLREVIEGIVPKTGKYSEWQEHNGGEEEETSFLLEPSPESILELLARDLAQIELFHFVLESNASEHSSRMIAMKNATENATSLQEELNLELNKARQAAITQELTEISTAKEALSSE